MTEAGLHGTYAGYLKHQRTGIRPCAACRNAQAEYSRIKRRRGKCVRGLGWPAEAETTWDLASRHPCERR